MEIVVVSRSGDRRSVITSTLNFYAKELGLQRSRWTLTVRSVRGLARSKGMNGAVALIGEREIMMLVDNSLTAERLLTTLAHEMVHVKQYAKGQLKIVEDRRGSDYVWLGQRVRNIHYYDMPWEREAFSRERLLANSMLKRLIG